MDSSYQGEAQNAIFNFLFVLVDEYRKAGLSPSEAVNKACDWISQLSNDVRTHQLQTDAENTERIQKFKDVQ